MHQRHGADVAARLLAEDEHVLKAAGHRSVIGGDAVKPADAVKPGHANQADADSQDDDKRHGDDHLIQPVSHVWRDRGADRDAENGAQRHGQPAESRQRRLGEGG